jgi:hypothetical protein
LQVVVVIRLIHNGLRDNDLTIQVGLNGGLITPVLTLLPQDPQQLLSVHLLDVLLQKELLIRLGPLLSLLGFRLVKQQILISLLDGPISVLLLPLDGLDPLALQEVLDVLVFQPRLCFPVIGYVLFAVLPICF